MAMAKPIECNPLFIVAVHNSNNSNYISNYISRIEKPARSHRFIIGRSPNNKEDK